MTSVMIKAIFCKISGLKKGKNREKNRVTIVRGQRKPERTAAGIQAMSLGADGLRMAGKKG